MHKSLKITSNSEGPPPIHVSRRNLQPYRDVVEDLTHAQRTSLNVPLLPLLLASPMPSLRWRHLEDGVPQLIKVQTMSSITSHRVHVNPCPFQGRHPGTSTIGISWHVLNQLQPWLLRTKDSSKKDHSWKCHDSLRRSLERCGQRLRRHEKDISGMQVNNYLLSQTLLLQGDLY